MMAKLLILLMLGFGTQYCFAQLSAITIDKNKVAAFFQNEQYSAAIEYLESKKGDAANDIDFLNALGYAYFMNNEIEKAAPYYQQVILSDSTNFTANRYRALIATVQRNYNEALFYYQRLIRIQPSNAMLYKLTGNVYRRKEVPDSALMNYASAYYLQPQNARLAYSYTDLLLDKKFFLKSDSILNNFLKSDSLNFPLIKLAVRSAYEQKAYAVAAGYTNKWMKADIIETITTKQLALANYNIKQYEDCILVCNSLLQQGIESETLAYYASRALYQLKQYKNSNALLQKCLNMALSKQAESYYAGRADNFEALHMYASAVAGYDSAYYLFKNPLALYNIGRIYETELKNKAVAQQYYK